MRIDFITLFPELVLPGLRHSILKRAEEQGSVQFSAINPRDFALDAHHTVDDTPFGGGPGMVLKPDIVASALDSALAQRPTGSRAIIIMEPWGERFSQSHARQWSQLDQLIILCGHYEGIDARIEQAYEAQAVSMGDFILTGGELPAMIIADAVTRLLPGVLGDAESLTTDSHSGGLLSYPQYTRPWDWRGLTPPEVLKSGNHEAIKRWRRQWSLQTTRTLRPDLFATAHLEESDLDLL